MVIWSEFRMRQYRDDDHQEDAPHFSFWIIVFESKILFIQYFNNRFLNPELTEADNLGSNPSLQSGLL